MTRLVLRSFGTVEPYADCVQSRFSKLFSELLRSATNVSQVCRAGASSSVCPARQRAIRGGLAITQAYCEIQQWRGVDGVDASCEHGVRLEFAEALGIAPQFSCRSGICGTCATPLLDGAVDYLEEAVAPRKRGEVPLRCSVPRPGAEVMLDH